MWDSQSIADREFVGKSSVQCVHKNHLQYGSVRAPITKRLERAPIISNDDTEALFTHMVSPGWLYQDEIAHWLEVERGVTISQSSVFGPYHVCARGRSKSYDDHEHQNHLCSM